MRLNPFDDLPDQLKAKTTITYLFLVAANIGAWLGAWIAFADRPILLGTAFLAYVFGLRHAGVPPLKWSTFWDRIIPFSGGGRNGRQARETRGYHSETSAG